MITAIDSAVCLPCNDGAVVVDFSHCTIVPALVDCSVSLSRSPSIDARMQFAAEKSDLPDKVSLLARHIGYCHAHGVLGVAVNDDINILRAYGRRAMARERIIDIRASASFSCGGRQTLAEETNGDFIKFVCPGSIEDNNAPFSRPDYEALCCILRHRGGRKVVVTANGPRQVEAALKAGCDAIEQGYGMGEENLRTMAARNVLWIPSVLRAKNALDGAGGSGDVCCRFSHRYVAPGKPAPGAEAFWKKTLAGQLQLLRSARKLGVTTAVGSGAGSTGILHGESVAEEMKLFIKAGYSREETIRCASANGAEFFGMNALGRLRAGGRATFLITRGTVQQLPRKLSYLEGIYVDGAPSVIYRKNPAVSVR